MVKKSVKKRAEKKLQDIMQRKKTGEGDKEEPSNQDSGMNIKVARTMMEKAVAEKERASEKVRALLIKENKAHNEEERAQKRETEARKQVVNAERTKVKADNASSDAKAIAIDAMTQSLEASRHLAEVESHKDDAMVDLFVAEEKAKQARKDVAAAELRNRAFGTNGPDAEENVAGPGETAAKRRYSAVTSDRSYEETHNENVPREDTKQNTCKVRRRDEPREENVPDIGKSSAYTGCMTRVEQKHVKFYNHGQDRANYDHQTSSVSPRCPVCCWAPVDALGSRCNNCSYTTRTSSIQPTYKPSC